MFIKNRQENFLIGISSLGDKKMKTFYRNQEIVILDKSADLVLVEFVVSGNTEWVREEMIRFSY